MKIIYQNPDNTIAIIMPCDCGMTTEQIAEKDVPHGIPYLICEDTDIPADWSTSSSWECDFSTPHGIGLGAQRYFIREAEAKIVEIKARAPDGDISRQQALIAQMKAEVLQLEGVAL